MEKIKDLKSELSELDKKHFLHPTSSIKMQQESGPAYIFVKGRGIYLEEISGETFIDGMSSLWNVNIGHGREELGRVANEQMNTMAFSSAFSTYSHEPAIRLAKKLSELTPGDLNVCFFTSGGSESNDSAIKMARHYWKLKGKPERKKILSRKLAYHGVSMGATSATGIPEFHEMTSSLAPDFVYAPSPNARSWSEIEDVDLTCIDETIKIIEKEGPETIAAFIMEPIQGAGGMIIPPNGYLKAMREICDKYGILLIADEIITGFGRTGKMFGVEHWDVTPDMMTVAKGITSGYIPLGAVIFSDRIHQELIELSTGTLFHGFTYSGHPTACMVGLKNIEIIENENLVQNTEQRGIELSKGLTKLEEKHWSVGGIRNKGLLGAFELYQDCTSKKRFDPSLGVAKRVVDECLKRKLIVRPITYEGTDTIAIAPPLISTKEEIEQIVSIFSDAVSVVESQLNG
ncbi:aspartate aminotransferase family protein [Virgibacillus sp. C22-A2]|uniref:Aspartate aminotransferase family protein n=1 Tax=Virgibacillus tibetensis TaxID=3042313 RepID=A0ABU6KD59_9BACI|nr:aspartate aminotransferase family protein [Virgibacillus sp. C22-A2]